MHIKFKILPVACIAFAAIIFLQLGCKKHDKFPEQSLPNIIAISPASAIPGAPVDIRGVNLKDVSAIRFGTTAAVFSVSSDTLIQAIVPDSLPAGKLYVQVYVGDGEAYAAKSFTVLEAPKIPSISSVAPASGFPGDAVTITGVNFLNVSAVKFGEIIADYTITSDTKIQTAVPANATGGNQLITVVAAAGSDTISFNVDLSPVITSFAPASAQKGDVITVSGIRFTGATAVMLGAASTTFTVVNDSTITFIVPSGASSGNITVTTPNGSGTSNAALSILVAGLAFPIYDDAVTANWTNAGGWIGGGWGGSKDLDNTSPIESGSKSCRIDYIGGWGSPLQLGGASVDLSAYSSFKIAIYGGPGSNGLKVNIGINQADAYTITLVEGQWTDYQIPLSSLTSASVLNEIWIKEYNGTGGFTIYVDNMGLN